MGKTIAWGAKKRAMIANEKMRKGLLLPFICLVISIVIVIAGLWPFNFRPKNQVTWLIGQDGIRFGRRGIAYSTGLVYGPRGAIHPGGPVTFELVVLPLLEPNDSLAQILTLYDGGRRQFFTLAQWKSSLILRTAAQGNDLHRNFRELAAPDLLLRSISRFLTVTSQNGNTSIYADGRRVKSSRDFPLLSAGSSASGEFIIGNSPTGNSPWEGELLFLAAYDRELSAEEVLKRFQDWAANGTPTWSSEKAPALLYRFDEREGTSSRNHSDHRYNISIPATFEVLDKIVLRTPWQEAHFGRSFVRDVVVNILGFLPFGIFFAAWLGKDKGLPRKSNVFFVAALGGGISLAIELTQVYLPDRTSSLTDVICNIFGAILGAFLSRWIFHLLRLKRRT